MKLSVIIPVYNERTTVRKVIERVTSVDLGEIQKEIIVTDDGSTDGSGVALVVFRFSNLGYYRRDTKFCLGRGPCY